MHSQQTSTRRLGIFAVAIGLSLATSVALGRGDGGGNSSGGGGGNGSGGGGSSNAGGGTSGSNGPASNGGNNEGGINRTGDTNKCYSGMVWNARRHMCMKAQSGVLPDDELTNYAYALAEDQRYQEALDILDLLQDQNTPKALNYRGYATRKLGRLDEGIGYYLKSVQLDPQYAQVREYLGEAYVVQGKIDLAQEQLEIIMGLCGTTCEEYTDLNEAIASAKGI